MRVRLGVTSSSTWTGKRQVTRAMDTDTTVTAARATPMQRLMFSVSPRPQYWLTSTAMPLWKPKITTWMMKMGTLAAVTAAISALPSRPTMKVSAKPRDVVIRFCKMMGRDRTHSRR